MNYSFLPEDFGISHLLAVIWLFGCWFSYSLLLSTFGRGSLNAQLAVVRRYWMSSTTRRISKPFDAVLLGNMMNSIAFFGSAQLIVLAGVLSTFTNVKVIHDTISDLDFFSDKSLELFALEIGLLALVLSMCFLSYTYALRKLIYTTVLIGALPDISEKCPTHDTMVEATTTVLSEAIRTLNFGIRGYYYTVATICMFISPYASLLATTIATIVLFYRQLMTPTARAIQNYVEAARELKR
ncbi:MAG: DUF599 domain-containing protein [Hyphomicrobiaceae bacterium]|nr:DUF599 domain-containing protein [Hyphomicrobiaceae bacterium]